MQKNVVIISVLSVLFSCNIRSYNRDQSSTPEFFLVDTQDHGKGLADLKGGFFYHEEQGKIVRSNCSNGYYDRDKDELSKKCTDTDTVKVPKQSFKKKLIEVFKETAIVRGLNECIDGVDSYVWYKLYSDFYQMNDTIKEFLADKSSDAEIKTVLKKEFEMVERIYNELALFKQDKVFSSTKISSLEENQRLKQQKEVEFLSEFLLKILSYNERFLDYHYLSLLISNMRYMETNKKSGVPSKELIADYTKILEMLSKNLRSDNLYLYKKIQYIIEAAFEKTLTQSDYKKSLSSSKPQLYFKVKNPVCGYGLAKPVESSLLYKPDLAITQRHDVTHLYDIVEQNTEDEYSKSPQQSFDATLLKCETIFKNQIQPQKPKKCWPLNKIAELFKSRTLTGTIVFSRAEERPRSNIIRTEIYVCNKGDKGVNSNIYFPEELPTSYIYPDMSHSTHWVIPACNFNPSIRVDMNL